MAVFERGAAPLPTAARRLPIQLVRQDKALAYPDRASVMWRIGLALYAKAGGVPWKLADTDPEIAYIGLSYAVRPPESDRPRFVTCCSHLTANQIQSLYRMKLDAGLAPATIHSIPAVLRGALKQAVRRKLLPYSVAEAVELPKLIRYEGKAFSVEEAKKFLEGARQDRLETLYVLAITCGLRQGELLGLKWDDVDLKAATMKVRRPLQRMRDGSGLAFLPLKNPEGRREVALGPMAVEALRRHHARQAEERLLLGTLYEDMGLVFATPKGTPWRRQTWSIAPSSRSSSVRACRRLGSTSIGTPAAQPWAAQA